MEKIFKCSFFYNCLSQIHNSLTYLDNGFILSTKCQADLKPLIWTATHLSKHLFLRNHWAVWLFRSLDQNGCNPHIWENKICSIISCSWPWPILTLLRRSGERLMTFRSSSFILLRPINNLSVINGQVFLSWASTKLGLMCLAQGHNTVTPVRFRSLKFEWFMGLQVGISKLHCKMFYWPWRLKQWIPWSDGPGHVAQSVTCLIADTCLTADPGVTSLIPAWSHAFVEIDHEIVPPFHWFKKGCCQLQAKVCARSTG